MLLLKAPSVVEAVGLHLSVRLLLEPPRVEVTSVVTVSTVLPGSYVVVSALPVTVTSNAQELFSWAGGVHDKPITRRGYSSGGGGCQQFHHGLRSNNTGVF